MELHLSALCSQTQVWFFVFFGFFWSQVCNPRPAAEHEEIVLTLSVLGVTWAVKIIGCIVMYPDVSLNQDAK